MCFENDLLLKAAQKYKSLIGTKLIIIVGRKNKQETIIINFKSYNFYHLAGLHKLKDIQAIKGKNTSNILNRILKGKLTDEMIEKSSSYNQMKERLKIISEFPEVLKNDKIVWKFNKVRANGWSKIKWDYLIDYETSKREAYIFLRYNNDTQDYYCVSAFNKGKTNYSEMQTRMTVLKVTLINSDSQREKIIYQRNSFSSKASTDNSSL